MRGKGLGLLINNKRIMLVCIAALCFLFSGCGQSDKEKTQVVTESNNSGFESSHTEVSSDDVLETKPVTTVPEKETENSQETASDSVQTETGTYTENTGNGTSGRPVNTENTKPQEPSVSTKPSDTVTENNTVSSVPETENTKIPTETPLEPQLPVTTPEAIDYTKLILSNVGESELEIYNKIMTAIENVEETVYFSYGTANQQQVENCLLLTSFTALETNYVSTKYVITVDEEGYVTRLRLDYTSTREQYRKDLAKLERVVEEIVNGCTATDTYGIVTYIHDQIIKRCRYNSESENMLSAYGCLVDGKAVCEGYSKAFIMLCAEFGIECVPVIGTTTADGVVESHMWNMAKIDGVWYHFDVTWDDPITKIGDDFVKYDYFGLSDNAINKDHTATDIPYFTYPRSYSETGNYFTKNKLTASTANGAVSILENEIMQACITNERFVRVRVSDDEEFDKLSSYLFDPDEKGKKEIFGILKSVAQAVDNEDFNPGKYSKLVNEEKNILTIILNYE